MKFNLKPGKLSFADIEKLLQPETQIELDRSAYPAIRAAEGVVTHIIKAGKTAYGINTGFGGLADTRIKDSDLSQLQRRLVISTAAGVGEYLSDTAVRLILALKINSLARGYSGVRLSTIEALISLFNARIYPCIPSQGSVGASGDLAPLAHLAAVLLGIGEARHQGKVISATQALKKINLAPIELAPKEGLSLVNGTQASTALCFLGWRAAENIYYNALISGALSVDAARACDTPFDERIQMLAGHETQIKTAALLRELLHNSEIRRSHLACNKVQDPYSLRCQPQVMGACLNQLMQTKKTILTEANGVSDNPLIFSEQDTILSGGNFHAEAIAMAADSIAVSLAEMGGMSERRIALLIDPKFSGLPAFLVKDPGLNCGFMTAQVTAAALASENKTYAHPASIDSIPTSANQEDHVSMATFAARRLQIMAENCENILAIEFLSACQGIDFLRPLKTSAKLESVYQLIREHVPFYAEDRFFAPDIAAVAKLIQSGETRTITKAKFNMVFEV